MIHFQNTIWTGVFYFVASYLQQLRTYEGSPFQLDQSYKHSNLYIIETLIMTFNWMKHCIIRHIFLSKVFILEPDLFFQMSRGILIFYRGCFTGDLKTPFKQAFHPTPSWTCPCQILIWKLCHPLFIFANLINQCCKAEHSNQLQLAFFMCNQVKTDVKGRQY